MGFREARREEAERIPWIGGPRGALEAETLGAAQDDEVNLLKDAVKAQAGPYSCPDDALDLVGDDLGIHRFPDEPNGTAPVGSTPGSGYRGRLCKAWPTWEQSGTSIGVEASLKAYGFADVRVYEDFEGHFAQGEWYSRFWIVIGPDFGTLALDPLYAPFTGGPETTGGSTATPAQVRQVKLQILKWKSGHSYPVMVILHFPGVILSGINSIAPFTPPEAGSPECHWHIGKLIQETIFSTPFIAGGYEV